LSLSVYAWSAQTWEGHHMQVAMGGAEQPSTTKREWIEYKSHTTWLLIWPLINNLLVSDRHRVIFFFLHLAALILGAWTWTWRRRRLSIRLRRSCGALTFNKVCKSILRHFSKQTDLHKIRKQAVIALLFVCPVRRFLKIRTDGHKQIRHADFSSIELGI